MAVDPEREPLLTQETIIALLAAESVDEQRQILQRADLLSSAGLAAILAYAQTRIGQDPLSTRRLAALCVAIAVDAGASALVPRARYLQAQTHAVNGEFAQAHSLIEAARTGFEQLGDTAGALRTNLGLMNVLSELGRPAEAVAAGQRILAALTPQLAAPEARGLAARVQTNLGTCYTQMGEFEAGLAAYAEADAHYQALNMAEQSANVSNNRGIALLYLGRAREARDLFAYAAEVRGAEDQPLLRAQSLANLGEANLLLGDYSQALPALETARTLLDDLPAAADSVIVLRKLGDAYLALNLVDEALETYQAAAELAAAGNMSHQQGWIWWGWGAALIRAGRWAEADPPLAQAAELFAGAENAPLLSSVWLEQAALWQAQGRSDEALCLTQNAWALVAAREWHVQQIYVALRMVDLVWGDEAAVAEWLDQAAAIAAGLTLPHLDYRIDARLGRLRLAQRQYDEAERALGRAIDRVETVRGTVAQEALRTSFLHDKASIYADLLRLYLERNQPGDLARAFEIVERSRARVLVDLLQGLVQSHLTLNDEEAQALAEIQSDLDALYNRLLEGDEGGAQRGSAPAALHLLEKSIRHLHLRAAARVGGRENAPVAAVAEEAQHGAQFDLAALRAMLGSQGCFVSFFELDNEFGAFVIDDDDLHVVRGLGSVSVVQSWVERLAVQWERFRIDRRFIESHLGQLERSTRRILGELYQLLWLPLTPYLRRMAPCPVTLIPHGVLHQIPFHALHDGETYLLQQHIFTYAPNATVHLLCQKRQPPGWGDTLVLGTTDARTPLMQVEAERVAVLLPGATCLVGKDASLAALDDLLRSGRGYDLVHLACHGLFRADNPIYSALKLEDGWLKAVDLLGFPLDGALVVLSACESGRSRVVPGNELLGLPRAVLGAGARTAVVSQWIVQDDAAAQCMELFYQARGVGADTASALRQAQISLAATRPHPYYWAAFMAMGAA